MQISVKYILSVVLFMSFVHFGAVNLGFYEGDVWIDMPLHVIGGILSGMIWMWLVQAVYGEAIHKEVPAALYMFMIVAASLVGSFAWEILEYLIWVNLPEFAKTTKFYSPTVDDLISDLALGLVGGSILAVYCSLRLGSSGERGPRGAKNDR